jgi:hypothetical protein
MQGMTPMDVDAPGASDMELEALLPVQESAMSAQTRSTIGKLVVALFSIGALCALTISFGRRSASDGMLAAPSKIFRQNIVSRPGWVVRLNESSGVVLAPICLKEANGSLGGTNASSPKVCSQCWCRVTAHTEHMPDMKSNESQLTPCFEQHETTDLGYGFPEITVAYGGTCYPQYNWTLNASIVRRCLAQHPTPTIYLVGDSHSIPTRFAFAKIVTPGYQLEAFGTASSLIKDTNIYQTIVDRLKQILKPSDVVVVHERLDACGGICDSAVAFEGRMKMLLEACQILGTKVLMLGDNPLLPVTPNTCLQPGKSSLCSTSMASQLSLQGAKRIVIGRLVTSHSGIALFYDQLPLFCSRDGGTCLATIPGTKTRAFFDITHNSQWGAEYMWPFLCRFMEIHKLILGSNIR